MTKIFNMPTFLSELSRDEGRRLKPYLDTAGKTTPSPLMAMEKMKLVQEIFSFLQ
ncbi:hypothetical protein [Mycetohabitans sp. B2]|jgi:hypothetical protein|uniref:hypothetical protein n=1 Tax=Mycetohabitans sp. B2 TaxID=2841274 RepID=UPI001F40AF72|nr:hypothetical protein [Mycetohabitans sp. B2]